MPKLGLAVFAVAFSLVWSSAFIVGKIALVRFDPATLLTLRFALSATLLAPFAQRQTASVSNSKCLPLRDFRPRFVWQFPEVVLI